MQKKVVVATLVLMGLLLSGCVRSVVGFETVHEGKVVDGATGTPLSGAVVFGAWFKGSHTVGGTVSSFYDAKETLTDGAGRFRLPGVRALSSLSPMYLVVYKAGYQHLGTSWDLLKKGEDRDMVAWRDGKPVVFLKKMSLQERVDRFDDYYVPGIPGAKKKLLLEELAKERKEIGG